MFEHGVKLTANQKQSCEVKLLVTEFRIVVSKMKNAKSPGSDGFTVEFWIFFSQLIFNILQNVNCMHNVWVHLLFNR